MRHLYDLGVQFWFELGRLGGHSTMNPAPLGGGGGVPEILFYPWVLCAQWSEPPGFKPVGV